MMRQGYWYTKNGHTVEYALGREGGRTRLRGGDEDHRRRDEASQRPHLGHGRPSQIDTCKEGYFKEAHQEANAAQHPDADTRRQAVVEFYEMVHRHGKTPIEWLNSRRAGTET